MKSRFILQQLCLFFLLGTFSLSAQNIGNFNPNTSSFPNRVGIGTSSPNVQLHINSSTSNYSYLSLTNLAGGNNSGTLFGCFNADTYLINQRPNGRFLFRTATGEKLVIEDDGNVGIGVSTPGVQLAVGDDTNAAFALTSQDVGASAVLGIASGSWAYSSNAVAGDVVFGPKGGASHDLILSAQNNNQGAIRFKSGPIAGDVEHMTIKHDGKVGIGTINPVYDLDVAGTIRSCELKVNNNSGWCFPDYVFEDNYDLISLKDLEAYIIENKHLPKMPAAAEVEANGLDIADMELRLVEKVEELTLYILQQQKEIDQLKEAYEALNSEKSN